MKVKKKTVLKPEIFPRYNNHKLISGQEDRHQHTYILNSHCLKLKIVTLFFLFLNYSAFLNGISKKIYYIYIFFCTTQRRKLIDPLHLLLMPIYRQRLKFEEFSPFPTIEVGSFYLLSTESFLDLELFLILRLGTLSSEYLKSS